MTPNGQELETTCTCCTDYTKWKTAHTSSAKVLQQLVDTAHYYKVCPEELVKVDSQTYQGTIRALSSAPKGACQGHASLTGNHPLTCDSCDALQHGRDSPLLRKLRRAVTLKHPRTELNRACQSGVMHKYCSKVDLDSALRLRKVQTCNLLWSPVEKVLEDSWTQHQSARPFVEKLVELFNTNSLSEFDTSFLSNWLGKKGGHRFFHTDEQARNLAVLLSNRLREKMYSTIAPMMGLPGAQQAQRIRAKDRGCSTYMPGLNDWAFASAGSTCRPYHNSMDGTRVVRTIELYLNKYLIGDCFALDVRLHPSPQELPTAESWEDVERHVLSVRREGLYAAEAYSFDLVDTTGCLPDMLTGSIPEAPSGVTASHLYAIMLTVEQKACRHRLSLVGHCTDSASNALNALLLLATPTRYLVGQNISFLGLSLPDYFLFSPFLRTAYPSIAYPCWDHSGRTVVRNLMNLNRNIVSEVIEGPSGKLLSTATVQDLHQLKRVYPSTAVKYGDITKHIRQNCDATSRVLTVKVITKLADHVPRSSATQLFLQAVVWTHVPYRNERFGPPPAVARSLWAGITTWRRWRQYILL